MSIMNLGRKIYESRKSMGLTQKELGKRVGVCDKTVSAWEHNRNKPDDSIINKIAAMAGLSFDDFLEAKEAYPCLEELANADFLTKMIYMSMQDFSIAEKHIVLSVVKGIIEARKK